MRGGKNSWSAKFRTAALLSAVGAAAGLGALAGSASPRSANAAPGNIDGSQSECQAFRVYFDLLLVDFGFEIAEEGWVYANGFGTSDRFREASGVVTKSKIAHNDTPANHYSHDWNVDIRVDPGQEGLVSDVNGPNATGKNIEMEWETGITPDETSGDGASPSIPRWVLPNLGDRAWTEGHWVFDCGHSTEVAGVKHFPTEIHPARAFASMRSQADVLPGTGTTPVPVTSTDLYIHGSGVFMVQQLACGIDIIIDAVPCPTQTTPIDDLYSFEVCLPPKPVPWATISWSIADGPDDSGFGADPEVTKMTAAGGCLLPPDEFGNEFDSGTMINVEVDLRGSGIAPEDVYSRKIVAGWVFPPSTPLPHLTLLLSLLDLHEDHEFDPFDGEMTFWWMGLDRAPSDEWHRLVNWEIPTYDDAGWACFGHTNYLEDIDDDGYCGNGELQFSGPLWDFYLRHGQSLSVRTTGFEQDCYDDHFGSGDFNLGYLVDCHFGNVLLESANDWGNNDALTPLDAFIVEPGVDPLTVLGYHNPGVSDFDFDMTLSEVPLADEDTADLGISKACSWDGEVALAGRPFTCTIVVSNSGPGLPRNVVVADTLESSLAPADYNVAEATFRVGAGPEEYSCGASTATGFSCAIGTVPVGGTVTIEVVITSNKPGSFTNSAGVSTDSTDANDSNDESADIDIEVYLPVVLDISPGSTTNPLNVSRAGVMSVAILTTPTFDASQRVVAEVCFGDAESPGDRACGELHGAPHVTDVDKDKDNDLEFHFKVADTGIDLGDTSACIKGTTSGGTGFYGCDRVTPF